MVYFTKKAMSYWKKRVRLHTEWKTPVTEDLEITRGVHQGDSLSPLLFCVSLILFTEQMNKLNTGYEEQATKTKESHLHYMDDR
jgi:hypothetical protein